MRKIFRFSPGVMGASWYVLWHFFIFDKPSTHPTITQAERIYIEESIGEAQGAQNAIVMVCHTKPSINQTEFFCLFFV